MFKLRRLLHALRTPWARRALVIYDVELGPMKGNRLFRPRVTVEHVADAVSALARRQLVS
jgi:hypothetical protein